MTGAFEPRAFGRTGFMAGPLGVGSSYGVGAKGVEEAFERGANYFYWAWRRRSGMRDGLRSIIKNGNREKIFITITSLLPTEPLIRACVGRALKALGTDYVDGLQFYLRKEKTPSKSQRAAALELVEEGTVRHMGVSGHHRPNFPAFAREAFMDFLHVRYNAKHRGAETDVFPHLPPKGDARRPGVVAFTVTSWKQLIKARPDKLGGLPAPTAGDCYRFALASRDVDVCMTGPADDAQMRHALDALDKGPMTGEEIEWMRNVGDRLHGKKQAGTHSPL